MFDPQDLEHVLARQRLEIEPVGSVVIGRDSFGVAVDHDRLERRPVPLFAQRKAGVDAAIVELDPLPDPVGTTAEDDDFLAIRRRSFALGLTEGRGLIGRIHIGRDRLEFGRAAVDPLEHRKHAKLVPQRAHLFLAGRAGHGDECIVEQARTLGLGLAHPARHAHRTHRQRGEALVGEAHRLQSAQACGIARQSIGLHFAFGSDDLIDLAQEPWIVEGDGSHFLDAHTLAEGLRDLEQAVGRAARERGGYDVLGLAFELRHAVEPVETRFQPPQRLLHRFLEIASDRHDFADALHRGRKVIGRALELLEGETRDLGDDVIDGRLETRRCRAGDLVGELVERVADRELGRDAGDGKAGRLGGQCRRPRDARVHLDHDQASILWIDRELHVRTARLHPDLAQASNARIAHDLVFLVGQCQRRGDGDRVASVHPHRIDVLDRADDDRVVLAVAHHLHLEFFPPEQRFLDQHFGGGRGIEAFAHDLVELGLVIGDPAAGAAEREAGADDRGQSGALEDHARLFERVGHARARAFQPDRRHRIAEPLAVLGLVDRIGLGPDHLDPVFRQRAISIERQRAIERGLSAHCRQ